MNTNGQPLGSLTDTDPTWEDPDDELLLWLIHGDGRIGDGGGGEIAVLVLTRGIGSLPDPHKAIEAASRGRCSFTAIEAITRVSRPQDADPIGLGIPDVVANQTGCEMAPEIARGIAELIIHLAERGEVIRRLRPRHPEEVS
jgi:hypothetical protein